MRTFRFLVAAALALACGLAGAQPTIFRAGSVAIGSQVVSGTATRVLFIDSSGNLAGDSDMTFATDTLTVTKLIGSTSITSADAGSFRFTTDTFITRYAAKQVMISGDGTGATTNAGLICGYLGASGYGACWPSTVTPSSSNYALAMHATNTILNSTSGNLELRVNDAAKVLLTNVAGRGPDITAGTAASAVSALTVTQTRNYNTSATDYLKYSFTLTSNHANDNIFAYYGGAGGVTSLMSLTAAGALTVAGVTMSSTNITGASVFTRSDSTTPGYAFGAADDTKLTRISAGVIGVGTGAAASVAGTISAASALANTHDRATAGTLTLGGTATSLTIPTATVTSASSGTRFLCISTAGVVTSSASACSGT